MTDLASCEGKSGKMKDLTPETIAHFGKILSHSRNELDSGNGSSKCEYENTRCFLLLHTSPPLRKTTNRGCEEAALVSGE